MDYQEAIQYLYSLRSRKTTYGIERMRLFADALGNPHVDIPIIHVAGTNGKGSVCAMLESVYRLAKYKTGLFTSPHLIHLGERIQIDRKNLEPDHICAALPRLQDVAAEIAAKNPDNHPSFFEFITAMGFDAFRNEAIDILLLETGLGGRLDASNIVSPMLSIITSIGLDHTEILGNSIEKIAIEKAGIIKPHTPVLVGLLPPEAETTIKLIAKERSAPFHSIAEMYGSTVYPYSLCNFQRINAAIVHVAVNLLNDKFPVSDFSIDEGIKHTQWYGRWQTIHLKNGKQLILDATHNEEGARFLEQNLIQLSHQHSIKPHFVFGTVGETRCKAIVPIITKYANSIHLVKSAQLNATDPAMIEAFISDEKIPLYHSNCESIFPRKGECAIGNDSDLIIVTGSIYLIGEVLARLQPPELKEEPQLQG